MFVEIVNDHDVPILYGDVTPNRSVDHVHRRVHSSAGVSHRRVLTSIAILFFFN